MTYFGEKLLLAVRPNTKLAKDVRVVAVTRFYTSQSEFEKKMAIQRGSSLNKRIWVEPIVDEHKCIVPTLAQKMLFN